MPINDKELETKLHDLMEKLERRIDAVGPTPLRHNLSYYLSWMLRDLRGFDQHGYEYRTYMPLAIGRKYLVPSCVGLVQCMLVGHHPMQTGYYIVEYANSSGLSGVATVRQGDLQPIDP